MVRSPHSPGLKPSFSRTHITFQIKTAVNFISGWCIHWRLFAYYSWFDFNCCTQSRVSTNNQNNNKFSPLSWQGSLLSTSVCGSRGPPFESRLRNEQVQIPICLWNCGSQDLNRGFKEIKKIYTEKHKESRKQM